MQVIRSRVLHALFVIFLYALAFAAGGAVEAVVGGIVAGAAHTAATSVARWLAWRVGEIPARVSRAAFVAAAVALGVSAVSDDPAATIVRSIGASAVWLIAQLLIVRARMESLRGPVGRSLPRVFVPGPVSLVDTIVSPDSTIRAAIEVIDRTPARIALVASRERRLLGTLTDGDVRRAILRGATLADLVSDAMEKAPVVGEAGQDDAAIADLMRQHGVRQIPLVDHAGRIVDLRLLDRIELGSADPTPVLIMAGGMGTRLQPLTRHLPKALVRVRGRPILEILLGELADQGFRRIIISVGHKGDAIQSHFGDGGWLGVRVSYVKEDLPLGTAGAIRLAAAHLDRTFIVANADLLTRVNFGALVDFHRRQDHVLTLGATEARYDLRYGLVETAGTRVTALREKPSLRHFVNAGIYALEPALIDIVPAGERYDMDALINEALRRQLVVGCFPIHEYWTDIGVVDDLARAASDYPA